MSPIPRFNRGSIFVSGLVLALLAGASTLPWTHEQPLAAADVQVSLQQFRQYMDEWSEPEGYFDSDNFISNETSYLHVIDQLQQRVKPGGIYLGVGPDQNLSYIVHTRPMLAVITDIRRQNMLEHLLFKSLFAMAGNRVEYLSLLFSRQTPRVNGAGGGRGGASFQEILDSIRSAKTSEMLFQTNWEAVKRQLTEKYRLGLSADDLAKIEYVYRTFWKENLDLRFSSIGRGNASMYPSFEEMLVETDRQGRQQSYLASEDSFQWLKKFQAENRLIPIVGDFAGPHALKAVGAFLKTNGLRLSVFYTSNVEFYLFGRPNWTRYVANLRSIPVGEESLFIRSYFPTYGRPHPLNLPGHRSTSLVSPIMPFLAAYDAHDIRSYWDVVKPQ
jgi:hypothetical protein